MSRYESAPSPIPSPAAGEGGLPRYQLPLGAKQMLPLCQAPLSRRGGGDGGGGRLLAPLTLFALLTLFIAASPARAWTITRVSSPVFYIDVDDSPKLLGNYVAYQITNDGASAQSDVWVALDTFTGGVISLAPNEDGLVHLGAMAAGATKTAFFYLQASGETTAAQSHSVRVYPTRPPGGAQLASQAFTLTSAPDTIDARANKVTTVVSGPNPAALGGIMTITVTGDSGTVGGAGIMSFTPAAYVGWPANAYEMISSRITLSGGNSGVQNDKLYFIVANSADTHYVAEYTFRAVGATSAPTSVSPVGYINSGNPIKHTDTSGFASLSPIQPTSNALTLAKSASPSSVVPGGTVTYTLRLSNANGSVDASVEDFADILPSSPGSPVYVPGSATFNGAPIPDPVVSGRTLAWIGTFDVPANTSRDLTFRVTMPSVNGTYTNTAVAHVGSTQIDTTTDTNSNTPAAANVTVAPPAPDLVIAKTHAPAGAFTQGQTDATYTLTVTNSGTPGSGTSGTVTVADTLPAGLTPTGPTGVVNGWTCTISGQQFTASRSDALAAGASYPAIILTVNVAANAPAGVNALTNTATVSGGGETNTANDSASDPTTIAAPPALSLTKTVTDVNNGAPEPGDTLEYRVTITSTGPDGAASIVLGDVLPAATNYVPGSLVIVSGPNAGAQTDAAGDDVAEFDSANRRITLRLGTGASAAQGGLLAPSASTVIAFRVTVAANAPAGATVNNQATATFAAQASGATGYTAASNTASLRLPPYTVSGVVFEDVNYGGGSGRSRAASGGVVRSGARVELYDASGAFVAAATTNASGAYSLSGLRTGTFLVRVVAETITSSRPGGSTATGLVPVQTFRATASAGTATADTERVGGEDPARADAGANTTSAALSTLSTTAAVAQCVAPVLGSGGDVAGVDFGFNFDVVNNTNNAGQGSLRQFLLNSNALGNTGLAQQGLTAGTETAIFLLSDGAAHSGLRAGLTNLFSGGVATITLASALPQIIGSRTTLDGARQTAVTGDTNPAVAEVTTGPEIILRGAGGGPGLSTRAASTRILNIGVTGATGPTSAGAGILLANGATGSLVQNCSTWNNDNSGIYFTNGASGVQIRNNVSRGNGVAEPTADGIQLSGGNNDNVFSGNQVVGNAGFGIDFLPGATNDRNTLEDNLFKNNGTSASDQDAGIGIRRGSSNVVRRNLVTGNPGAGILLHAGTGNTFTENAIHANGALGIDLGAGTGSAGDGVTKNDDNDADAGPNDLVNFPVIESATLGNGSLILSGYARPGAIIELFLAAPDPSGFGEGQTYLATLTEGSAQDTDAGTGSYSNPVNGLDQGTDTSANRFRFTLPAPAGVVPGAKLTATATLGGATSEFSGLVTIPNSSPNLLLVKRITRVNGADTAGFVNDPADSADDNANWPQPLSTFLRGTVSAGTVRPGDVVEYTIYFLSSGTAPVTNVLLCDVLKNSMAFVPGAFNGLSPRDPAALPGADLGIGLALSASALPTVPTMYLSNFEDDDRGRFYLPGTQAPAAANRPAGFAAPLPGSDNVSGVIAVSVVRSADAGSPSLPPATGPGVPANSYGFVRFRVTVK